MNFRSPSHWLVSILATAGVVGGVVLIRQGLAVLGIAAIGLVFFFLVLTDDSKIRLPQRWSEGREWAIAAAAMFAAFGTVAAAVFAQVQIKDERSVRQHNEDEQRTQEFRKPAEAVSAWPVATDSSGFPTSKSPYGEQVTYVDLSNSSAAPVYQVVVSLVFVQGAGPHTGKEVTEEINRGRGSYPRIQRTLLDIPPGRSRTYVAGGWGGMGKRAGIEIGFTDQAGNSWIRYSNGALESLRTSALEYYGVGLPTEFATPEQQSH